MADQDNVVLSNIVANVPTEVVATSRSLTTLYTSAVCTRKIRVPTSNVDYRHTGFAWDPVTLHLDDHSGFIDCLSTIWSLDP